MKKRIEILPKYPVNLRGLSSALPGFKGKIFKSSYYLIESETTPAWDALVEGVIDPSLQMLKGENFEFSALYPHEKQPGFVLDVQFLPGVTDNSAKALEEALKLQGISAKCASGSLYYVLGECREEDVKNNLAPEVGNSLIQSISVHSGESFLKNDRFEKCELPGVKIHHDQKAYEVSLEGSLEELMALSKERCLALNENELQTIKAYYEKEEVQKRRLELGLPKWPTDVEIEVLAQTWSEHCKHKIFAATIDYTDSETGENSQIKGLYPSFIKKATKDIEAAGVDWLVSVFSDNAGIVRFDENVDLCIKVETHNSPSALDPYGGAITGILGVNRDIMGCGLGAKPIANTDVFCLGSTELPQLIDENLLPAGLMEPAKLLRGVHKGVEDGGNKSGIPTINGAMVFDQDYAGKPLVFCGTVGLMSATLPDGRAGDEKGAKVGDEIYVIGGAVGADGIHGATFSSMELNEDSPATAVQIGDPLTQKRVMDFLMEARDLGLYTCITDNGAGGIASSIGEMAELTGGAKIDLNTHPRKYPGLSPWEIMISESQERMTCAVDPKHSDAFSELAKKRGVSAFCMGHFSDSGFLEVFYKDERVALLEMEFLHDGVPTLELKAKSVKNQERQTWVTLPKRDCLNDAGNTLKHLLNRENIASKAPWVRQYDHEVQGATIGKPFGGSKGISPGDAGVIDLEAHGGSEGAMAAVGCGLAPRMSMVSARVMAKQSVDEAVRNIIATGVDPKKICLLDNFCWPDPVQSPTNTQGEEKLGQLVDTCSGLYDICTLYKTPLVSGKDSMKNDFRGKNRAGDPLVISIQPTLLVTSMGYGHQDQILRSVVEKEEVTLYHFGHKQLSFVASELAEMTSGVSLDQGVSPHDWDYALCKETYDHFSKVNKEGLIHAAHDISDGGLLCAVSEMVFDHNWGVELLGKSTYEDFLLTGFGEGPGQFILAIENHKTHEFERVASELKVPFEKVATINSSGKMVGEHINDLSVKELRTSWQRDWSL